MDTSIASPMAVTSSERRSILRDRHFPTPAARSQHNLLGRMQRAHGKIRYPSGWDSESSNTLMQSRSEMPSPFPNFFIVGAARAGTTSFADYMRSHPDVFMSPIKEPHYFSSDIDCQAFRADFRRDCRVDPPDYFSGSARKKIHQAFIRSASNYDSLFSGAADAKVVGEASTSYLFSSVAAERIHQETKHPRILILLRNPVERAYSHFLMDLKQGYAPELDFVSAVEADFNRNEKGWGISNLYVELGRYAHQVKRYLNIFSPGQVKILFRDDYENNLPEALDGVFRFLGLDPRFSTADLNRRLNSAQVPRYPSAHRVATALGLEKAARLIIPRQARSRIKRHYFRKPAPLSKKDFEQLLPYFRESTEELSQLLKRDLRDWSAAPSN